MFVYNQNFYNSSSHICKLVKVLVIKVRPENLNLLLVHFSAVLTLPVLDNVNVLLGGYKSRTLQLSDSDSVEHIEQS